MLPLYFDQHVNAAIAEGRPFAGVVFAHQLKTTIGQAITDLEIVCQVLTPEEAASQLIRLPL